MRTRNLTRCMILAFVMVFMTAGIAFAGVGGADTPTVTPTVAVGQTGLPWSFTIANTSTTPNSLDNVAVITTPLVPGSTGIYFTTTCGSALSPALPCPVAAQEAPNTITISPLTAIGAAGTACAGVTFTVAASPTGNPNEYVFTPATTVVLGPSGGAGGTCTALAVCGCTVNFTVDINALPVHDSSGSAGLQTSQLALAPELQDETTLETGFAAGSSTISVVSGKICVTKNCTSATSCTNPAIDFSGTATNCGTEILNNVTVTDVVGGVSSTLTCAPLGANNSLAVNASCTYSGSYQGTPGSSTTDTVTATGTGAVSAATFTATASATCSAPVAPAICVTKNCTSATSCTNPTIGFSGTVTNCGCGEALDSVTVTDVVGGVSSAVTCAPLGANNSLAVGASCSYSGSYQGTPGSSTTDTVTASGTGAISAAVVTASASATCSAPVAPSITVTKNCTNATSCANPAIGFSGTVTNSGCGEALNGVTVTDVVGGVSSAVTCAPLGANNSLAVGASCSYSGSYQGTPGSSTTDTVTASGTGAISAAVVTASASATCSAPAVPSITVTKNCTNATSCTNPTIGFSGTVTNNGCGEALNNVTVTDVVGGVSSAVTCAPLGANNSLAVGASCSYSGSYQGTPGSSTTDTVTASGTAAISAAVVTASASATCSAPVAPSITVTKNCTNATSCTNPVGFSGTVTNSGCGEALNGVTVTDVVGGVSSAVTCAPLGANNSLAVGASCSFSGSYTGTAGSSTTDTVTASGTGATSATVVTSTASATCSVPACPCQVKITKQVAVDDGSNGGVACDGQPDGPFGETVTTAAGNCVVFEICVENSCTDPTSCQTLDTTGVLVTDQLLGITGTGTNVLNFDMIAPGVKKCKDIPGTATAPVCTGGASGTACVCTAVEGLNTAVISAAVCETTNANACDQTGSVCSDTASVACTVPTACRMTGGHNNSLGSVDATFSGINNKNGRPTAYTTGGQIGAPSAVGCCDFPSKTAPCINGLCSAGPNKNISCESDKDCPNTGRQSSCPWGDWEHSHHGGPDDLWVANNATGISDGSFDFHSGTAAAPPISFIHNIICEDPGWCVQARPAPDKQIFWEGTGVFHSTTNGSKTSPPLPQFLNCPSQPVPWSNKTEGTVSYYRAHVGDFGEPAGTNQNQPPLNNCQWTNTCGTDPLVGGVSIFDCKLEDGFCPFTPEATNQKFTALHPLCLAQNCGCDVSENNCTNQNTTNGCPDWYEIEIRCGVNPSALTGMTPAAAFEFLKAQPIAYKVAHFITQGNFQLHPQVGSSCNPSCGNGICEPGVLPGTGETCANCPADCGVCPPQ